MRWRGGGDERSEKPLKSLSANDERIKNKELKRYIRIKELKRSRYIREQDDSAKTKTEDDPSIRISILKAKKHNYLPRTTSRDVEYGFTHRRSVGLHKGASLPPSPIAAARPPPCGGPAAYPARSVPFPPPEAAPHVPPAITPLPQKT